jgi:hypothetical protein
MNWSDRVPDEMKADLTDDDINAILGTGPDDQRVENRHVGGAHQSDQQQNPAGRRQGNGLRYCASTGVVAGPNGEPLQRAKDGSFEQVRQNGDVVQRQSDGGAELTPEDLVLAGHVPLTVVTNSVRVKAEGDAPAETIALSMRQILYRLERQIPGWPSRVNNMLFIDDKQHGLGHLEKQASLFGWLAQAVGKVQWSKGTDCVGKEEFFEELQRTARQFRAIESCPHFPPVAGHYYSMPPGVGSESEPVYPSSKPRGGYDDAAAVPTYLDELVDRFDPASDLDRDLIMALFVTPAWGGPGGARPAFVITAPDGRGVGKTAVAKAVGRMYGGHLDISLGEDIGSVKKRLLSSEATTRRCLLVDNAKTNRLSWAELESLITCYEISGHKLYHGEHTRPNTLLWMLTLNGPSLSRDLAQRCIMIQLKRPQHSATWEEDLNQFIAQHRWDIFSNIAAFFIRKPVTLPSCSRWGAWERSVLALMPEPEELQRVIAERQTALDADDSEACDIEDHFAKELARLGYDPATDSVHVPNEVARLWYGRAIGAPVTTTAATRAVGQAADEGLLKRLRINPSRHNGRGFLWFVGGAVAYDLEDRQRDNQWRDNRHWDR